MWRSWGKAFLVLVFMCGTSNNVAADELLPFDVPNFFLIGSSKSGTTSLFDLLTKHPEICTATKKEYRYFTSNTNFSHPGSKRRYTDFFAVSKLHNCTEGNYTIDGTPYYILHKEAAQHLAAAYSPESLAQKKFMLVLRDPVARQFSWYLHQIRECKNEIIATFQNATAKYSKKERMFVYDKVDICKHPLCREVDCKSMPANENLKETAQSHLLSFPEYVDKYMHINYGIFAEHIKDWTQYIRRDQLFVFNGQTLYKDTDDTMHRLATFLGLKHDWGVNVTLPKINTNDGGVQAEFPCSLYDKLEAYYRPHNEALYALMAAGGGPATEPPFPKFVSSRKICTDVAVASKS
jgi:hypothetical protein